MPPVLEIWIKDATPTRSNNSSQHAARSNAGQLPRFEKSGPAAMGWLWLHAPCQSLRPAAYGLLSVSDLFRSAWLLAGRRALCCLDYASNWQTLWKAIGRDLGVLSRMIGSQKKWLAG
jgi:hypothetical protein